jgi:hypothetical protein
MSLQPSPVEYLHSAGCSGRCGFRSTTRVHHDRLLSIEHNPDEVLELMELAVTWGELDYSGQRLVPPQRWLEFADAHDWHDHDRASRVFSLAYDIALHSSRLGAAC